MAGTAQDDELLLERKILREHCAHATSATQRRGDDGQVGVLTPDPGST
jgi:hypothetical protein